MPSLGPAEILVILVVALIVLGPNKLPEAGRQLGKALAEIRRWSNTVQSEIHGALNLDDEAPPSYPTSEPISSSSERPDAPGVPAEREPVDVPRLRPPSQFPEQQSFN